MDSVIRILEHVLEYLVPFVASVAELIGIAIIILSMIKATYHYFLGALFHGSYAFRHEMGSGLATALEFLMAAEVAKTILLPDFRSVLLLAAIFGLRALMSILIHAEIRGPRPKPAAAPAAPSEAEEE